MKRTLALSLALVVAAALPTAAADDETYTIKIANAPGEGKSVKATEVVKIKQSVKVLDEDGKALKDDKIDKTIKQVYTEKTLKAGAKKAKKYSRSYTTATEATGDESQKLGYDGKTVVFELSDGKYKATAGEKQEIDEKALDLLEQDANKDPDGSKRDALLPRKAVKVGDTWKIDGKVAAALLEELKPDAAKTKGQGKLVKAYKKGGKQWGVMEFTIDAPTKAEGAGKAEATITVDVPIDGSSATGKVKSKLKFSSENTVEQNGMKFKVQVRVDVDSDNERADVK